MTDGPESREALASKNEITKIKDGILKVPENSFEKLKIKPELKKPMSINSHVKSEPKNESTKIKEASEHFSEKLKIESESKMPMSIKSHVKSAPQPAESMEIILKKIAQDLESKEESNEATLPPGIDEIELESQHPLSITVRKDTKDKIDTEIKKVVSDLKVISKEDSVTKSVREDIVDIMKQVELMKETKPSVTEESKAADKKVPRKLKQGNADGSRQEFIMSSFEDTTVPVRY